MKQTRHTSERMIRKYVRSGELFVENAVRKVGLRSSAAIQPNMIQVKY